MKDITISTIHWSKYLDEKTNPRVKNFLKSRGDDVMWQVALNVDKAGRNPKMLKDRLVMLVHENAPYAIRIPREEYEEVLELSLQFFQKSEQYEKCAQILKFKNRLVKDTKESYKTKE